MQIFGTSYLLYNIYGSNENTDVDSMAAWTEQEPYYGLIHAASHEYLQQL